MHRYERQWPDDRSDWEIPRPWDHTYRDARGVAEFASLDPLTLCRTWPEVWHLDDTGTVRCCSKGSSIDSVRRFAEWPSHMLDCRLTDLGEECPDFWVVVETRREWHKDRWDVTESDAQAFLSLRSSLAGYGITLLDVVIFREDFRWWSLHELTSGTTTWRFEPSRPVDDEMFPEAADLLQSGQIIWPDC